MDKEREDEFLKAARAASAAIQIDPNATKRNELQGNLLRTAVAAAQAKAEILAASKGLQPGQHVAQRAFGFRNAEREAQNALSTYIEWEAGLML